VPVDPRLLERVLRSLEEEARLDADVAYAELRLKLERDRLRLR
jgi:hypothetical protein